VANPQEQVRRELLNQLLEKISDDPYPSITMMDMAEELITPDELTEYIGVLMEKITDERFPSVSMLGRIRDLALG
jgi:hypothetical protein